MPIHAFVDESVRRDRYLLCAALIPAGRVPQARSLVREFCLPGQRRWHFAKEPDQRRRHILSAMKRSGTANVAMFEARGVEVRARHECLTALLTYLVDIRAERLIVESREAQDQRDRHTIAAVLHKASAELPYAHVPPHNEPGLWWPDAIAWAFGAGGAWKTLVLPMVQLHRKVEEP
ncbi:hypothetical protein APR12_002636 [Nocardia amikacinitolerans]|uniref:hypothetical protein n=1 Tax=Nocardia amikacinitolerans TaxID=756689 RepID=UPI000834B056|nr:hypothetical protein [Nocardia amikacinitolerans]MCP2317290.1 hypothetical protein [Nocardia amikacinitolerans]